MGGMFPDSTYRPPKSPGAIAELGLLESFGTHPVFLSGPRPVQSPAEWLALVPSRLWFRSEHSCRWNLADDTSVSMIILVN
jgi:hypothetical protein